MKKLNFIITIRYEIPTFSSVGPFFKEGGGGDLENLGQKLKFWGFFQLRSPLRIFKGRREESALMLYFERKNVNTVQDPAGSVISCKLLYQTFIPSFCLF